MSGTCPSYSKEMSLRKAEAQPILESATCIVASASWNSSGISGKLETYSRSTLNPTPVPHNKTYIISSKTLRLSIGT